jgi:hypothetical protein
VKQSQENSPLRPQPNQYSSASFGDDNFCSHQCGSGKKGDRPDVLATALPQQAKSIPNTGQNQAMLKGAGRAIFQEAALPSLPERTCSALPVSVAQSILFGS